MKRRVLKAFLGSVGLIMIPYVLIVLCGLMEDKRSYDLAVVLGNKVNVDGRPSARLAARLDRAYVLWTAGRCSAILVSGGTGLEGWDEAKVMKLYLVAKGVSPDVIIVDSEGSDTWKTALKTKQVLGVSDGKSVVAISQFFHLPRCKLALKRVGLGEVSTSYARYWELRDVYATLRELPALLKYWFVKARIDDGGV